MAKTLLPLAPKTPAERRRANSLRRFGRRRYSATAHEHHTGHDFRMLAVRAAARVAGPLSYEDILEVITGYGDAAEDAERVRSVA